MLRCHCILAAVSWCGCSTACLRDWSTCTDHMQTGNTGQSCMYCKNACGNLCYSHSHPYTLYACFLSKKVEVLLQVRCQAADAAVRAARSDLQACQTRLRDAEAQAQQLAQLLKSAGVSGMAVTSAAADDAAPVTRGGKRNHTAASASDQTAHSPAQVSPPLRNKTARVR